MDAEARHQVHELFDVSCQTRVWITKRVENELWTFTKSRDHHRRFLACLERYAKNGFWNYDRCKSDPIRFEGDGVYRVGIKAFLFRVYGFYETNERKSFIAIDAFLKKDKKLNSSDRARIAEVARILKMHLYVKVEDGPYPRLAQ